MYAQPLVFHAFASSNTVCVSHLSSSMFVFPTPAERTMCLQEIVYTYCAQFLFAIISNTPSYVLFVHQLYRVDADKYYSIARKNVQYSI